jgi:hypothetical protein
LCEFLGDLKASHPKGVSKMLVLSQTPGMRVRVDLGNGQVGFVHSKVEGGRIRLCLEFPAEISIARDYTGPREAARPRPTETRRVDYSSALVRTIWEGGHK